MTDAKEKGLRVTSACDRGVGCHLGLFLLRGHGQGMAPSNRLTHAPGSFVPGTVDDSWILARVFFARAWRVNMGTMQFKKRTG